MSIKQYAKRVARDIAVTLASIPVLLGMADAQSVSGTTRILDRETNTPLEGVRVDVDSSAYVAYTDSTGQFNIADLPAGKHNIRIGKEGYKGFSLQNYAGTQLNAALPAEYHRQPAGDTTWTIAQFREMVRLNSTYPNTTHWAQLDQRKPIEVFLSNGTTTDIDEFKSRISAGTGNWQDSPEGSAERNLEWTIYKITNDSAAASDHGVVVNFNIGVNSTAPLNIGEYMKKAICNLVSHPSEAEEHKETINRVLYRSAVTSRPSNLSYIAVNPTPIDFAINRVALFFNAARYEGKQNANLFDMEEPLAYGTPAKVALSTPENNALNIPTNNKFSWKSSFGTDNYRLQIATDSSFSNILHDTTLSRIDAVIKDMPTDTDLYWRVGASNKSGTSDWSDVYMMHTALTGIKDKMPIADQSRLYQNYPNPFNGETTIKYSLAKRSRVKLGIYDVTGREVAKITDATLNPGEYNTRWNTNGLSSGVYLYRLETDQGVQTMKMMLVK